MIGHDYHLYHSKDWQIWLFFLYNYHYGRETQAAEKNYLKYVAGHSCRLPLSVIEYELTSDLLQPCI